MRKSLPSLVLTFQEIYDEKRDADAYGLAKLLCTYKFVACLCDGLHTVAKLQATLQAKRLDLVSVPSMVEGTIDRLKELKESPPLVCGLKTISLSLQLQSN